MSADKKSLAQHGYAVGGGDSDTIAGASETLLKLAERLTTALDVWECCVHEYVPERDCLVAQAIWSRKLDPRDIDWIGADNHLNRHPDVARVFSERAPVVTHAEEEDRGISAEERMDAWGEKSALCAPIVLGDEILGLVELTEKRARREFTEADFKVVMALADVAAVAIGNDRTARLAEARSRRLTALVDSSRAISSSVLLEEVLQIVAEQAAQAMDAASTYIYLYDREGDAITWHTHFQRDAEHVNADPPGTAYPLSDYPWDRRVLETRIAEQVTQADEGLSKEHLESLKDWDEKVLLAVPLVFRDEAVGLMEVAKTKSLQPFSPEEVELAQALAEQAAVAVHNAKLYEQVAWRNVRLVNVLEISRALNGYLDADHIVEGLSERVGGLFVGRSADVSVLVGDCVADDGERDSLADAALRDGEAQQGPSAGGRRLVVPLLHQAEGLGCIDITSGSPRVFSRDEIELVQILANQAAVAIDNARLYAQIEVQAITDGLTGLYNHRYFYERLRDEVTRARRYELPVSLLMMDLDNFKDYNDHFGHPAGDEVLRRVGAILRTQLRQDIDVPARYGGEEFAVILPHTPVGGAERVGERLSARVGEMTQDLATLDGALMAGERVRHSIETEPFPGKDGREVVHVTISIGIASLPSHAIEPEELVNKADKALYAAKQRGKNRVEVFHPGPSATSRAGS